MLALCSAFSRVLTVLRNQEKIGNMKTLITKSAQKKVADKAVNMRKWTEAFCFFGILRIQEFVNLIDVILVLKNAVLLGKKSGKSREFVEPLTLGTLL